MAPWTTSRTTAAGGCRVPLLLTNTFAVLMSDRNDGRRILRPDPTANPLRFFAHAIHMSVAVVVVVAAAAVRRKTLIDKRYSSHFDGVRTRRRAERVYHRPSRAGRTTFGLWTRRRLRRRTRDLYANVVAKARHESNVELKYY